jgi:hypothetical protein
MGVVKDKYRGTQKYADVRAMLVRVGKARGMVRYREIAQTMGLPVTGHFMGGELRQILSEISEDTVRDGGPMLSAIAIGVRGKPGPGFFDLAKELGRLPAEADEISFWKREMESVFAYLEAADAG